MVFFVISQLFDAVDYSNYVFLGFWNYNSVIQALLASNILCLFISTEVTGARNFSKLTHHSFSIWTMSSSEHCRRTIFQMYNVQNLKITRITTFRICNILYQVGSRWDPKCVFNFLRFFERTLYKSNYIIFILSWCGTHTKIRSKLVDIVTAGSQKITVWGPQRTPLGILKIKTSDVERLLQYTRAYVQRSLLFTATLCV